jgi:rhodanese-related sulfurtransferase
MDTEALPCSPEFFLRLLGTARAPLMLDVRRRAAFEADPHLAAGATWRDPFAVAEWAKFLPRHRAVVVYCVHGHEISRNACAALRSAGLDARYLEGGIEGWRGAGLPTVKVRKAPAIPSSPGEPSHWVTRERPKIDRIACPWLVRRFIDPCAVFHYVPAAGVRAFAAENGAEPFDVPGAAFTHRGERCSFDAIVEEFGLQDAALERLSAIVRGADTDRQELAPESAGLLAISRGLARIHEDDHALLEQGMRLYDALYMECRGALS